MSLWDADCYDENSKLQQTIAENFLSLLQKRFKLKKNGRLLDVGCGAGRTTKLIFQYFPEIQILGVDASKEMIDFASRKYANRNLSFSVDRAEELETVETESVDAVVSFFCLHWVKDQESAFKSMFRVLKPGGWIGLMFAAETGWDDPIDRAYAESIAEEPWKEFFKRPAKEADWYIADVWKIRAQLETCGFEVVFQEAQHSDYSFDSKDAFVSWVKASFQQLKLLPLDLQEGCARRIVDAYLQSTADLQPEGPRCIYHVEGCMWMGVKPE